MNGGFKFKLLKIRQVNRHGLFPCRYELVKRIHRSKVDDAIDEETHNL